MTKIKSNIAVSDTGFIFNPANGESFSTNPIGIEIFNLIKQAKPQKEIFENMLEKYNTDKNTLEKDYNDFVQILNQFQLLDQDAENEA